MRRVAEWHRSRVPTHTKGSVSKKPMAIYVVRVVLCVIVHQKYIVRPRHTDGRLGARHWLGRVCLGRRVALDATGQGDIAMAHTR